MKRGGRGRGEGGRGSGRKEGTERKRVKGERSVCIFLAYCSQDVEDLEEEEEEGVDSGVEEEEVDLGAEEEEEDSGAEEEEEVNLSYAVTLTSD